MTEADTTGFAAAMTPAEALMWRVGADPWLDPSGSLITVLDQPLDVELLRARLAVAVVALPRLAERVTDSSNPLAPPRWEPDPDFDLTDHLIEVELPAPGDHQSLLDFATDAQLTPFAPERPPWRMYAVSGLEGGGGALVGRLHHSVADGIGAMRMAETYLELERHPPPPESVDLDAFLTAHRDTAPAADDGLADFLADALRVPLSLTRGALAELALAGSDPARLRTAGGRALELARELLSQLTGDTAADSASDEWAGRSGERELVTVQLPFDTARQAARQRDGSINDVFVATMAEAALLAHDNAPAHISMSYVRSTRAGDEAGGNAFVPNRITAPGPPAGRETRFRHLHDAMRAAATGSVGLDQLGDVAALLPNSALSRMGRDQGRRIDVVTSNLHGSPVPLFIAGAEVQALYPIGPVAGAACNATLMSYCGSLDVGIMVDPAAIDDASRLAEAVLEAFALVTA